MKPFILGIDPGTKRTGIAEYTHERNLSVRVMEPDDALNYVRSLRIDEDFLIVIEGVSCYGMRVGEAVFKTAYLVGRFQEIAQNGQVVTVGRGAVKAHLTGSARTKDKDVRAAVQLRWAADEWQGVISKVRADGWSALALLTWGMDQDFVEQR